MQCSKNFKQIPRNSQSPCHRCLQAISLESAVVPQKIELANRVWSAEQHRLLNGAAVPKVDEHCVRHTNASITMRSLNSLSLLGNACGLQWRERKAKEEKLLARDPKRARSESPPSIDRSAYLVPSTASSPTISRSTITITPYIPPVLKTTTEYHPPSHGPKVPTCASAPSIAPLQPAQVRPVGKISIINLLNPLPA